MKFARLSRLVAIATAAAALSSILAWNSVKAITFEEKAVDQTQFIAIARPYGENKYDLLVIEQIPGKQACWSESGSNPVLVDPLLLNFDFTGICRRSTDSNGYSIRIAGQDYGLDYLLSVVEHNGELELVGISRTDPYGAEILVGRTRGLSSGNFHKILLEPGWRFGKRTYEGKELGHVYFSTDQLATGTPTPSAPETTTSFTDISNDIYKPEIQQAVALGFIAGFNDQTFRPTQPLTREQLVSMVIDALKTIPNVSTAVSNNESTQLFNDVEPSRWSAAKIAWAQQNNIVDGYPNNTFQPTQPVKRAELMAVLHRAAEYAKSQLGQTPQLTPTQNPKAFSDIAGHWSEALVEQMSAYCGVASPLNETGSAFAPNTPALRNYAAAATLRTLNCIKSSTQ
ncbi:MAG: DUF3747 domain-containing protein [Microcystaceae cyanobacterium]